MTAPSVNIIIAALTDLRRLLRGGRAGRAIPADQGQRVSGSDGEPHAHRPPSRWVEHPRRVDGARRRPRGPARRDRAGGCAGDAAVIRAIEQADIAILNPGSLFTSTIPALLRAGVPDALAAFAGPMVYGANVMTQPGETAGFTLSDHLRAITGHVGPLVSDVLVYSEGLPVGLLSRYFAERAAPVEVDHEAIERLGVLVHQLRLLPDTMGAEVRHDRERLALACTM